MATIGQVRPLINDGVRMPLPAGGRRLRRYYLRGLGQTPGCPPDLGTVMDQWVQGVVSFPSSLAGADPGSEALAVAEQACVESSAGTPFGCPPMAGCDQMEAIAAAAALRVASSPRYQSVINYGAYAPPSTPTQVGTPPTATNPLVGRVNVQPTNAMQPPAAAAVLTPAAISNANVQQGSGTPIGPGGATPGPSPDGVTTTGTNTDITTFLQNNWILIALGVGALVFLPQLMKGGGR